MNYSLNSRNNRIIEVCNSYMGDNDNVIIDCINRELIKLGKNLTGTLLMKLLTSFHLTITSRGFL
jgi:hypothetical protein